MRRTVEEVLRHAEEISVETEVVVIDDGSTDRTRAIMEELCNEDDRCRLIAHDVNRGLGRCVTEAYDTIEDDTWVTVFPGDSEFVFAESIDNLLAARHGHDVVLGYLYNPVVRKLGRRIASTGFLKLTKTLYGFRWRSLNGMKLYPAPKRSKGSRSYRADMRRRRAARQGAAPSPRSSHHGGTVHLTWASGRGFTRHQADVRPSCDARDVQRRSRRRKIPRDDGPPLSRSTRARRGARCLLPTSNAGLRSGTAALTTADRKAGTGPRRIRPTPCRGPHSVPGRRCAGST